MANTKSDEGYKGLGLGSHTGTTDGATQGEVTSARGLGITDIGTTGAEPLVRDTENIRGSRGLDNTSGVSRAGSTMATIGLAGTNTIVPALGEDEVAESDRKARQSDDFGEEAGADQGYKRGTAAPELGGGMGGTSDSETAAEDAWSDVPSPRPDDKISRGTEGAR
jgi:hypothetical protein